MSKEKQNRTVSRNFYNFLEFLLISRYLKMSEGSAMEAINDGEENVLPIVIERLDIIEIIDSIESKVEALRAQVSYLEDEREAISTALDTLRQSTHVESLMDGDREDILLNLDRLTVRVASVDVSIKTVRDPMQEEALSEVNDLINRLVGKIEKDSHLAKVECVRFLNSCTSDAEAGPTDKLFETALLGCTLDDQKRIHKRLHGLMNYLQRRGVSLL